MSLSYPISPETLIVTTSESVAIKSLFHFIVLIDDKAFSLSSWNHVCSLFTINSQLAGSSTTYWYEMGQF